MSFRKINLRREPYEAARLDRAGAWQVLRAITMPAIAALVVVMLVIRGIEIVKIFDTIFALTAGGPGTSTETLSFYAYQVGFKSFELSYAAAISWFLLVVVVIASLILFKTGARNLFRI